MSNVLVSTLAFSSDLQKVVLVQKRLPYRLSGRWTAIGGRLGPQDANTATAALRGLREEAGLEAESILPFARCERKSLGHGYCVFFAAIVPSQFAQTKTDKPVMVWDVARIPAYSLDFFSDDLPALIEMAKMKLRGSNLFFTIQER